MRKLFARPQPCSQGITGRSAQQREPLFASLAANCQDAFVEIHVATPLEVCAERDPKGLYKKAMAGEIEHFTGVDDPYEIPSHPELRLHTEGQAPAESAAIVLARLEELELIESKVTV